MRACFGLEGRGTQLRSSPEQTSAQPPPSAPSCPRVTVRNAVLMLRSCHAMSAAGLAKALPIVAVMALAYGQICKKNKNVRNALKRTGAVGRQVGQCKAKVRPCLS